MSSLFEHCHGEKTHFSRNEKRTFSLSQMNNVEFVRTLSWRENALFEEREKNVFVKPNEQCRACSNIVMARKRTFRGTKKKDKLMLSRKRVVKMPAVRQQSFRNRQAAFLPYNKEYEKIKLMTYKLNYP